MSVYTLDLRKKHNSRAGRVSVPAAIATATHRAVNGYSVLSERGTRRSDGIRETIEVFITPTRTAVIIATEHYKVHNTLSRLTKQSSGFVYPELVPLATMSTNDSELDKFVAAPAVEKAVAGIIAAIDVENPREFLRWTAKGGDPADVEGMRMITDGILPEQAVVWRHLGVSAADLRFKGRFHRISPTAVYTWQKFGITDSDLIAQFCRDNIDPAAWFLSHELNVPLSSARVKPATLGLSNSLTMSQKVAELSSTKRLLDDKHKQRTEVTALTLAGSLAIAAQTTTPLEAAEAAYRDGWDKTLIVEALQIVDAKSALLFHVEATDPSL